MVDHTAVHECDAGQREERSGGREWSGEKAWLHRPVPGKCVSAGQRLLALSFDKALRPTVFCTD